MLASLTKPSDNNISGIEYVRKITSTQDQTAKTEWGDGEIIYLTIRVTDTGRGLSCSEMSNLFTLFQQASPKTHVQYGGSGLGLFISRQLTEMQGGEIGVSSEPGKGSTFEFYVKARRLQPPEGDGFLQPRNDIQLLVREDALREACGVEVSAIHNGIEMPNVSSEFGVPTSSIPHRLQTKRCFHILVVEDNLVNQKVVTKQLRKAGHVVSVANHGVEAIEFIQKTKYWTTDSITQSRSDGIRDISNPSSDHEQPDGNVPLHSAQQVDIVLMDLEMPVMDGLSCVRWLRECQRDGRIVGHVPVVAVTANARKDQILTYLEAGMVSSPRAF
jgi:CheY-like chemotaxis protein